MPHGRVVPVNRSRYDRSPWCPGRIIGDRYGQPVAIMYQAATKLPGHQPGMVIAAMDANSIIHDLLENIK